jgi:Zn-finger nucleic acid-binding protein
MRTQDQVAAMSCPVCRVPLAMSERSGIEIDYCPQCRGVWLDRGELDKIIDRSAPETAPAALQSPAPQPSAPLHQSGGQNPWSGGGLDHGGYGHGDRHDRERERDYGGYGGKSHKKQKHWLSELFD